MKVIILQEHLVKVLTRVLRTVPTRPQVPILSQIKLSVQKDGVTISGTNLETTESVWIGGKVEDEGEVCVVAKTLFEVIASFPPGAIHIHTIEDNLSLQSGGFKTTLVTTPAAEFPSVATLHSENTTSIERKAMEIALSSVLFSAAADDGRPMLTGVKVLSTDGKTTLATTDGYRLSVIEVPFSAPSLSQAVIPARALSELVKVCADEKEDTEIKLGVAGERQIGFVIGDTTLCTRLLDGEFPNYERIIPKVHTSRAKIEKELFLRAVRSAAIFARDNANIVKLSLHKQGVTVAANAPQVGENTIEVPSDVEGDGGEIAFNSRFLIDFLTNFPDDECYFEMTGALNSGVFKPVGREDYLHIIMPVRVSS